MDISLLSKMIGELLLEREEVGLPGLGAFIAEVVPASFSDKGFTINPPYRRVSFIPSRSEDDSLVQLYSSSNGIDYDQAQAIIQHFLEETKKRLIDEKVVVFPGLGRLRSTRQNNFFFITDEDLDIFPDGFGLPPVSLKNHVETGEEVREHVEELVAFVEGIPGQAGNDAENDAGSEAGNVAMAEGSLPEDEPLIELAEPEPAESEATEPAESAPAESTEPAADTADTEPTAEPAEPVEPAPEPIREPVPTPKPAPKPRRERKPFPKWLKTTLLTILLLAVLAAIALAAFVILAQVAPDFIDSILYTPEELSIINYQ